MTGLVLIEDDGYRTLRPLTDVLPVPALRFGASTIADRWQRTVGLPLRAVLARESVLDAWHDALSIERGQDTEVLVVNAAAISGPWLADLRSSRGPCAMFAGGRPVAARIPSASIAETRAPAELFDGVPRTEVDARFLTWPWDLVNANADAIAHDLETLEPQRAGDLHATAALLEPRRIIVRPGARVDPFAVLDARPGPILVGAGAVIASHTVVTGPCVIGAGTQLLGGFVGRSTFGPECRIAGEVEECVWQGYANKRHHGFVGHSAIGEWVNLGALTTTSDLKNNYGNVRVTIDGREVDSGSPKVGSVLGAHVKTGIGTLLPTGAVVGVGSNLFGGGVFAPKALPSFSWWDGRGNAEHAFDKFLATARVAMSRRGREMSRADEAVLRRAFDSRGGRDA